MQTDSTGKASWIVSEGKLIYVCANGNSSHERRMLRAIASFCREQAPPWRMVWGGVLGDSVIAEKPDGVVVFALSDENRKVADELQVPVISTSSRNQNWKGLSVLPDDGAVGRLAADHFKHRLYRNFAFVGLAEHAYSQLRADGFAKAIDPVKCQALLTDVGIPDSGRAVDDAITAFLKDLPKPVAVLAANDIFARRVCILARQAGIEIPTEVAVLGVDADDLVSTSCFINLSSVDLSSDRIGYEAAALLARCIQGKEPLKSLLVPPRGVQVGASTAHLATQDELVSSSLKFIQSNACRGLTVEDVVAHSRVGRRTLELRFRDAVGRGINSHIRAVRIERAVQLLEQTQLTIGEIADKAGFANVYYFSNTFKKEKGVSPQNYRLLTDVSRTHKQNPFPPLAATLDL